MKKVIVYPSQVNGETVAPPSKSYTHRVLFIALLSDGETKLVNPLISGDTQASLRALKAFGAKVSWTSILSDGSPKEPADVINCSSSATTIRFSMAIAALVKGLTVLTGSPSLRRRPMSHLIEALKQLGIKVFSRGGKPPVAILGGANLIKGNEVYVRGDVSSQFISALLIISPKIGLNIKINSGLKSKPYVEMTLKTMEKFGVKVQRNNWTLMETYEQSYKPSIFKIPGDFSSAAFILAAGALFGKVVVKGLDMRDVQGDKRIVDIIREMGGRVNVRGDVIEVERSELVGLKLDCRNLPDLVPVLAVLGSYAKGVTEIYGVEHLRFKETDRLRVLALNLKKMGVKLKEKQDGLVIHGGSQLKGCVLNPFSDHRMAMALTLAALGAQGKSLILNAGCVKDSYPTFFDDLKRLNCKLEVVK